MYKGLFTLLIAGFLMTGLAACEDEGAMERTGERMDDAARDMNDAAEDAARELEEGFDNAEDELD